MPPPAQSHTRVLFVCGKNSARSQMAEGLLRHMARSAVEVASAGVESSRVHTGALQALAEVGIDISAQTSKAVSDLAGRSFDIVITLCDPAREYCLAPGSLAATAGDGTGPDPRSPVLDGMPVVLHWDVDDPARDDVTDSESKALFRQVRDRLTTLIEGFLGQGYMSGLKAQRERWESLLDSLEDGIIAHDKSRHIFLFNAAAQRILGIDERDVIGRDCHSVFSPDGLCGSNCSFCDRHDGESLDDRIEYEMDVTAGDGTDRRVRMSVSPLELEPGRPWGVIAVVRDVTEVSELRQRLAREGGYQGMVGISSAMRDIFETIRQISSSDYPVLITGESGTGKELVASAIHGTSRRAAGPFVPINCGALPDTILESELFGHVRGAFTGAVRNKKGRFELAHRGTIFLDEVGELSPSFQVKLLRVLQDKRFEMIGGERTIEVDVRVVSATNRDLRSLVRKGQFREDLFYRLCVVPLEIPALRDRREDIPLLVEHTLERIRAESGMGVGAVADDAMTLLMEYHWPGNVRELINALQFASVQCSGGEIQARHLPLEIRRDAGEVPRWSLAREAGRRPGRKPKLDGRTVARALAEAGGNRARAARILGVGRATLYRFLRKG